MFVKGGHIFCSLDVKRFVKTKVSFWNYRRVAVVQIIYLGWKFWWDLDVGHLTAWWIVSLCFQVTHKINTNMTWRTNTSVSPCVIALDILRSNMAGHCMQHADISALLIRLRTEKTLQYIILGLLSLTDIIYSNIGVRTWNIITSMWSRGMLLLKDALIQQMFS